MNYLDNNLMNGENVIYRCKPHWIIFYPPILWILLTIIFAKLAPALFVPATVIFDAAAAITIIITIFTGISALIAYITTEYGITNKRLVMKTGLIQRSINEIPLGRIESVAVYQSILGRILNYGIITINGIGGSKDNFVNIPQPLQFRTLVQEQLTNT